MIHILLVDDEPLVLVGIQSMLKWEDYDAEIIGTARNGTQALEFIDHQMPDLVITDIKMPVMDGLQLMSAVREKYGRPPLFILLTSYEEYQYVKAAINQQAVDYLVKLDLDGKNLVQALKKAKEQLSALRADTSVIRRPKSERLGMQPFYDRFFVRLFNNLYDSETQYLSLRKELGIDLSYKSFAVCYCELLDFHTQQMSHEKLMNLYSSTTHIVWDTVTRFMPCYITSLDSRHFNITFCMTEAEDPIYQSVLRDILEKVTQVVYNYFSVRMVCSVGCKVANPMELSESYYTARLGQTNRTAQTDPVVFFSRKPSSAAISNVFDMSAFRQPLIKAFEDQDVRALEDIINQMIHIIQANPLSVPQAMDASCNLLFLCLSQLSDGETVMEEIFQPETDGYRSIYRQRSTLDISNWMATLRDGLVKTMRSKKRSYRDKTIEQIKAYIQANLDKRLTLGNVAAVFGFSPNYLSQLFAKQGGCSFVEYITQEKIRAAKEMMQAGDVKIFEISEQLGFENAFYFSKVFKKQEGCSPREYMQKRKGG